MQTDEENLANGETKIYYSTKKTIRGMRVTVVFLAAGILLPIVFSGAGWAWYFGVLIIIAATLIGRSYFYSPDVNRNQLLKPDLRKQTTIFHFQH